MKILTIGDIFGRVGRDCTFSVLEGMRDGVDLIIANGENAAHGRGLSKPVYEELKSAGIDVFTTGNHVWGCPDIESVMRYNDDVIRPANLEGELSGCGACVVTARNGVKVGVLNLIGRTYIEGPISSPFFAADREIEKLKTKADVIVVDFHAEATSEKMALGYYLDGKVSAVFGTHTHIQTADNKVLPKGTGYITDLGMTGPEHSVLGLDKNTIISRFLNGMPQKFTVANGKGQFSGAIFEIDEETGKTVSVERIYKEL